MSSDITIPVADFDSLVARLTSVEERLEAIARGDELFHYGPCTRCDYGPWSSASPARPICCPNCHSAYWNRKPRRSTARVPGDPPAKHFTTPKKRNQRVVDEPAAPMPVLASPLPAPASYLPPELRPPGAELIPPPPRVLPDVTALRTTDNPMNVKPVAAPTLSEQLAERATQPPPEPVTHVAPLPDAVVEAILGGVEVGPEEIREAREEFDDVVIHTGNGPERSEPPPTEPTPARPTSANLQAKKDAFYADAIASGLVSAEPTRETAPDTTPFVNNAESPSLAPPADEDPFWK